MYKFKNVTRSTTFFKFRTNLLFLFVNILSIHFIASNAYRNYNFIIWHSERKQTFLHLPLSRSAFEVCLIEIFE